MTSHKHLEYDAAHMTNLPDHLQHLAEGIIIDWLIRTGQWDAAAQTKIAAAQEHVQEQPAPKARANEVRS